MGEDIIYRQAAIDAIESAKTAQAPDGEIYVAKLNAEMNIQILPSAQPERKKGKWLIDPLYSTSGGVGQVRRMLRCSECDHQEPWPLLTRRNFCPNCGADMR